VWENGRQGAGAHPVGIVAQTKFAPYRGVGKIREQEPNVHPVPTILQINFALQRDAGTKQAACIAQPVVGSVV
jgi:hypothetical protein